MSRVYQGFTCQNVKSAEKCFLSKEDIFQLRKNLNLKIFLFWRTYLNHQDYSLWSSIETDYKEHEKYFQGFLMMRGWEVEPRADSIRHAFLQSDLMREVPENRIKIFFQDLHTTDPAHSWSTVCEQKQVQMLSRLWAGLKLTKCVCL